MVELGLSQAGLLPRVLTPLTLAPQGKELPSKRGNCYQSPSSSTGCKGRADHAEPPVGEGGGPGAGRGSFWVGSPIRETEGLLFCRQNTMEGDCLSCMKYLMFVFNFFIFVSIAGTFLGSP